MFKKERQVLDANVSILTMVQHSCINFIYGLLNGIVIGVMIIGNPLLIFTCYVLLKEVDAIILNRPKYTTKLGKHVLYPLSASSGFYVGYILSKFIETNVVKN